MQFRKSTLLCLIATLAILSCKKEASINTNNGKDTTGTIITPKALVDVYVSGSSSGSDNIEKATYWKNDTAKILSSSLSLASAIQVSGKDIYVAGVRVAANKNNVVTLWKNGILSDITDSTQWSFTKDMAISGSDVYIAGYNAKKLGIVWKNGVAQTLESSPKESAYPWHIFIDAGNVYVAGFVSNESTPPFSQTAAYWLNGKITRLTSEDMTLSIAYGVTVQNNDLYVVGAGYPATTGRPITVYWKNGVLNKVGDINSESQGSAIAVVGQNIYIVGITTDSAGISTAAVWKNGVLTKLGDGLANSSCTAIAIHGNDVYITGHNKSGVVIWKNNVATQLEDGGSNSAAGGLAIVSH